MDAIVKLVRTLKLNGLDPDQLVLADDDPVLAHKLEYLKAVKAQDNEKSGRLRWRETKKEMLAEACIRETN